MQVRPDLAGFADAQQRKRDLLGEDVVFFDRPVVTFPPNTPLDPQTGRPYDPMIEATSSGQASAVVRCGVTFRAINRAGIGGESDNAAVGQVDQTSIMLAAPSAAADVITENTVEFLVRDELFKINAVKFDGIGDGKQRLLVYGRRRGL